MEAPRRGRMVFSSAQGMHPPEELTKALQEVQRLFVAEQIDAIKVYRENYDVSLARAKYAVEQIEAGIRPSVPKPVSQYCQIVKVNSDPGSNPAPKWLGPTIITAAIILFVGSILALPCCSLAVHLPRIIIRSGDAMILPAMIGRPPISPSGSITRMQITALSAWSGGIWQARLEGCPAGRGWISGRPGRRAGFDLCRCRNGPVGLSS